VCNSGLKSAMEQRTSRRYILKGFYRIWRQFLLFQETSSRLDGVTTSRSYDSFAIKDIRAAMGQEIKADERCIPKKSC
jgi:hypothetical protein